MDNKPSCVDSNHCCISKCRNFKNPFSQIDLYPLPNDINRRTKSCEILGIPLEVGLQPSARVCALHFKSKMANLKSPVKASSMIPEQSTILVDDGRRLFVVPRMQTVPYSKVLPSGSSTSFVIQPKPTGVVLQNVIPKELSSVPSTLKSSEDGSMNKKANSDVTSSSVVSLELLCEDDPLSTAQLNAYMKDLMDFVSANELVHKLPPAVPRVDSPLIPRCIDSTLIPQHVDSCVTTVSNEHSLPDLNLSQNKNSSSVNCTINPSPSLSISQFLQNLPLTTTNAAPVGISVPQNPTSLVNVSNPCSISAAINTATVITPSFLPSQLPLISTNSTSTSIISSINNATSVFNGTQISSPSQMTTSTTNVFVPKCVQIPSVVNNISGDASNITATNTKILEKTNLNPAFTMCTTASLSKAATMASIAVSPILNQITNQPIDINNSLPKETITIQNVTQEVSRCEILPNSYTILDAVSTNAVIPIMLHRGAGPVNNPVQFIDNSIKVANDGSAQSILRNVLDHTGFGPNASAKKVSDVLETCPVTLSSIPATTKSSSSELIIGTALSNQIPFFYDNLQGVVSKEGEVPSKKIPSNETLTLCEGMQSASSASSVTSNGSGPMIVKVISATEGASEYFTGDKIPNSLLLPNEEYAVECQVDSSKSDTSELTLQKKHVDKFIFVKKNSLFSLQKSIPMITFLSPTYADINYMFRLKIPSVLNPVDEAENLREKLRKENFIPFSVWWLLQKRYFPTTLPCNFCGSKRFIVDKDEKFTDGFCWICASVNCAVQTPIKRSNFFGRFESYSMRDLLLLTYHWACQSSLEEIIQDVNLSSEKIWYYFKALQELCHQALVQKGKLGIASGSRIETSVMRVGNVYVLGAIDRKTQYVRLEAITENEACISMRHILLLQKWIYRKSTLISEIKIKNELLPHVVTVGANPRVTDITSEEPHILTISEFLRKNLTSMFDGLNQVSYKFNVIQGFLYELQWRIKYGSSTELAFFNILNHMKEICEEKGKISLEKIQYKRGDFSATSNVFELNFRVNDRWAPYPENNIDSTSGKVSTLKFNQGTKSYAKNVAYRELQEVALLKGEMPTFSIYFRDVPEIYGGTANITPRSLLAIKIYFGDTQRDINLYNSKSMILGLRLNSESFINNPVKWLADKGFIESSAPCYVCQDTSILKENPRFSDGYSWLCQNEECKFENVFKRPSFFARFAQYPMSYVAEMIFFWITQSDVSEMKSNISLDPSKISDAWRSFQVLCSAALKRSRDKIGGSGRPIEVAMVRFGKLYVLGAMDRRTTRTFVQAFPTEMGQATTIYYTLQSWIAPGSTIIINATKNFKMHLVCKEYKFYLVTDISDKCTHLKNITSYLVKHIKNMFGHLKANFMRQEIMQGYLEELMWRDKFGKEPQQAFSWIMNEIFFNERRMKGVGIKQEKMDSLYEPIQIKELRVALQRIPNSVLKHYNIEIPESSVASENLKKDTDVNVSSEMLMKTYPKIEQCTASLSSPGDDEDVMVIEPDILINDNSENVSNCQTATEQLPSYGHLKPDEPSSSLNNFKVQPLVIKMHKKRKKFKSYLKSELESARSSNSIKKEISNEILNENLDRLKNSRTEPLDTASSDSCQSSLWDSLSTDSLKPSICRSLKKRSAALNTKSMCIECGESVTLDHFMKQFVCTDCKKSSVYTTYCSKAFFAHRSSLLFGKRMSRRKPDNYGLHHPATLPYSLFCACGFSSNQGNKLASHMVKCGVKTCYQDL